MKNQNVFFIILLVGLAAFPAMSTDVYLASMPAIQHVFGVTTVHVQLTLALFFLAFSVTQFIWGPLSDRFGRKPILYIGLCLYIISSIACSFASSIVGLIVARFFQAIGACSASVIRYAILRDHYAPEERARLVGILASIMAVAPMLAPIIGTYLFVHWGWRSNFYFLAGFGLLVICVALSVPETHAEERLPLKPFNLFREYTAFFSQKEFMLYAATASLSFAAMFSFISSSSFLYIGYFHIDPKYFGYLFALNAFSLAVSGFMFSKLVGRISALALNRAGLLLIFVSGLLMSVAYALTGHIVAIILPLFFATLGAGLGIASSVALALNCIKHYAGMGSAVVGALQYSSAAVVSVLMGLMSGNIPLMLSLMILTCGLLGLLCYCVNPKREAY